MPDSNMATALWTPGNHVAGMEQAERVLPTKMDARLPLRDVANCQVTDHPVDKSQNSIDTTGSFSQDDMEVFEAPSFMTIVDQQARELVEDSMPEWVRCNGTHMLSASAASEGKKAPTINSEKLSVPQCPPLSPMLNKEGSKRSSWQSSGFSLDSGGMNNASPRRSQSPLYGEMYSSSTSPRMGNKSSPMVEPRGNSSLTWLAPSLFPAKKKTVTRAPQASSMKKSTQMGWSTSSAASQQTISNNEKDKVKPESTWKSFICCCVS
eukprot:c23388_g2_i1 orf=248-1042(+)